jgi:hypothetical protein
MTTSASIDELCPADVGEKRIVLSLDVIDSKPLAHVPFAVNVDYSKAGTAGIVMPIELVFQGPLAGQRYQRVFSRTLPSSLLLTPRSSGRHLVLLRELFHNRWQGQLFVDVEGEDTQQSEDR